MAKDKKQFQFVLDEDEIEVILQAIDWCDEGIKLHAEGYGVDLAALVQRLQTGA